MKFLTLAIMFLALIAWSSGVGALTVDEIERLKKAGVSDAVIQKMIEQEAAGATQNGPVTDTKDKVTYSAGKGSKARAQRNREHEKYKEQKALDALNGVVIDTRTRPVPLGTTPKGEAKTQ